MIGAGVGDRGDAHLATSLALRDGRGEGPRARASRLRALAARKPRDETRPSGGEIAEKQLKGAYCRRCYSMTT